jgi:hypothetical protein
MEKKETFNVTKVTPRSDRRDAFEESAQKGIILKICNDVEEKNETISFKYDRFNSVSRGKNAHRLHYPTGEIVKSWKKLGTRDSKSFDALVTAENKKTKDSLDIFFFLKSTKEKGGYQDDAALELAHMIDLLKENKDENMVVICMVEGEFWTPELIEDIGTVDNKSFYATRENLEEVLTNILESRGFSNNEMSNKEERVLCFNETE